MKQKLAFALEPIQSFFRHESSSGILLLFFAVLAMVLANSAWAGSYEAALAFKLPVGSAEYHLNLSVLHWINDGLMAIFFFVVGLEIKREFFFGELQSLSATMLPVCAALGAGFLAWADVFSRLAVENGEMPIGLVVSLLGSPIFLHLLLKRKRG